MYSTMFCLGLPVTSRAQILFLEEELSRWLQDRGLPCETIKFLYHLTFPDESVIYAGTGLGNRVASRLPGRVLEYDNEDLVRYTNSALSSKDSVRIVTVVGLFLVRSRWDTGCNFERYEKEKWGKCGWTLLNRYDMYPPFDRVEEVNVDDWLGDAVREFLRLGKGD